ncbi:50S ribosomal protein L24 [archaeon]|nr:50S ribosomal protein L24 [archaeon]
MKKAYSNKWVGSSKPRKQRKYLANAPIHKKRKFLSVNLIKALREKYSTRNIVVRKGDKVKIMRGKFKGKEGKVTKVLIKLQKIYIEGIQTKKQDGSMVDVPVRSSNLQIIELNLDDKKRFKSITTKTPKKETKPINKEGEKTE